MLLSVSHTANDNNFIARVKLNVDAKDFKINTAFLKLWL